ncbi:transmembrane protein 205 isoform X2 [Ceratitis capitata]|uniref:transmembrane protein 205 isoform X2 n=1 Tax=Ceratitis capitata TaxID=7213 RepID=UPI0006187F91|nr:transmembrane protein 205 isoform X2 [Ceratitis capitata]
MPVIRIYGCTAILLTRTTQPAHLIAVCVLTFVIFTVWPHIVDTRSSNTGQDIVDQASTLDKQGIHEHSNFAAIAYLGAFATHFGAQIWMTFVSGLSLYFSLPRHIFGQCQQILFPRYFALSAILSISMLILFVKYFLTAWNTASMVQLTALGVTAFIEVMIRLYLAPPMLRLMHEKYRIEGAVGSGREVGTLEQGDLINCPHYQRIHKTFRRIHMTIAMGNMAVLLATCLHLYFLASKIQIS